jgi:hypothetical protein
MIEIVTKDEELYKFDPDTERIYKDGFLLPTTAAEPVYSDVNGATRFSGIYLKATNQIVTLSGNKNTISNVNAIQ